MLTTILSNVFLVVVKGAVGIIAGSHALIAEAAHSLTDVSAFIVNYYSCKNCRGLLKNGKRHPYTLTGTGGHRKISRQVRNKIREKGINSTSLTGLIYIICGSLVYIRNVFILISGDTTPPDTIALVVAVITVIIYVLVYENYKSTMGEDIKHSVVNSQNNYLLNKANLYAGTIVVIGITAAKTGFPAMDAMAGVAVGAIMFSLGGYMFHKQKRLLKVDMKDFIFIGV